MVPLGVFYTGYGVVRSIRELDGVDDVSVHVDSREPGEWQEDPDVDRLVGDDATSDGGGAVPEATRTGDEVAVTEAAGPDDGLSSEGPVIEEDEIGNEDLERAGSRTQGPRVAIGSTTCDLPTSVAANEPARETREGGTRSDAGSRNRRGWPGVHRSRHTPISPARRAHLFVALSE